MAKRLYEIAADLGMRTERVVDVLSRNGYVVNSAEDEIGPDVQSDLYKWLKPERSVWSRIKSAVGIRPDPGTLQDALDWSTEEEEQLEGVVAREELKSRKPPASLSFEESDLDIFEPEPVAIGDDFVDEKQNTQGKPGTGVESKQVPPASATGLAQRTFEPEKSAKEPAPQESTSRSHKLKDEIFEGIGEEDFAGGHPERENILENEDDFEQPYEDIEMHQEAIEQTSAEERVPAQEQIPEEVEAVSSAVEVEQPESLEESTQSQFEIDAETPPPLEETSQQEKEQPGEQVASQVSIQDETENLEPPVSERQDSLGEDDIESVLNQVAREDRTGIAQKTEEQSVEDSLNRAVETDQAPTQESSSQTLKQEPEMATEEPEEETDTLLSELQNIAEQVPEKSEEERIAQSTQSEPTDTTPEQPLATAEEQEPQEAPIPADDLLSEQLSSFEQEDSGEEQTEVYPNEEFAFSADDLLEQQLSEQMQADEQPAESETTASTRDVVEESVEEQLESMQMGEAGLSEDSTTQSVDSSDEVESTLGEITIDDLLGETAEEEQEQQPAISPAVEEQPETPEADKTEESVDALSLLGLGEEEQAGQEEKSEDNAAAETKTEGVGVADLLGIQEEDSDSSQVKKTSLPIDFIAKFFGSLAEAARNPQVVIRNMSNLELIVSAVIFLTLFSAGLFAFYKWWNYYRPGTEMRYFQAAERMRLAERHSDAVEMYRLVAEHHPDSSVIHKVYAGLADSYFQMGQYRVAKSYYERALHAYDQMQRSEPFPDFLVIPKTRLNMTRCLLQLGDYGEAKENLVQLAREYPGHEIGQKCRMLLGDLYMTRAREEQIPEKISSAIAEYQLAVNEYPGSETNVDLLTRLGDAYRLLHESQPESEQKGELLQEALRQYQEATTSARRHDRPFRQIAELRIKEADTRAQMGDTTTAIKIFDDLLATKLPGRLEVEALEKVARVNLKIKNFDEADRRARDLMDRNPDDSALALAYYILGDVEYEKPKAYRDLTRMMQHYQKAIGLDERSGLGIDHSQRAYMRMTNALYIEKGNVEEALGKYRQIVEKFPDGPYTLRAKYLIGRCLEDLSEWDAAAEAYQEVIKDIETGKGSFIDPDLRKDALYRRAEALYAAGQYDNATQAFGEALKKTDFPHDEQAITARKHLAESYVQTRDYDRAQAVYANLIDMFPETDEKGEVSFALADVHEHLFDYGGSRKIYRDLLDRENLDAALRRSVFSRYAESFVAEAEGLSRQEAEPLLEGAVAAYEEMYAEAPQARSALLDAGKILLEMNQKKQGKQKLLQFLEQATAVDPQAEAAVLLGELAWEDGNMSEAVGYFEFVEQLPPIPGDEEVRARAAYRLGDCYRSQQRLADAKTLYQRVLQEHPKSIWADEARWKLQTVDWLAEVEKPGEVAAF